MLEEELSLWHIHGTTKALGLWWGPVNSSPPRPRGGRSSCKVADSTAKGQGYF